MELLAIDGNALAHRCFHAGERTPDPHTFVGKAIWRIAEAVRHGCDAITVAFDSHENLRAQEEPLYKAGRSAKPPLFHDCFDALVTDLAACGMHVTTAPLGLEADDVLATIAAEAGEVGTVNILTPDRDMLALVSDTVSILRPIDGTLQTMRARDVVKQYGVPPEGYHHLAALRGDPSDGLKGVTGIGRRTAAKLIRRYGTVHELYNNVQWLEPRLEVMLRRDRNRVMRNIALMTPRDVTIDLDAMLSATPQPDRVEDVLSSRGVERAAGALRGAIANPLPPQHTNGHLTAPLTIDLTSDGTNERRAPELAAAAVEAEQSGLF